MYAQEQGGGSRPARPCRSRGSRPDRVPPSRRNTAVHGLVVTWLDPVWHGRSPSSIASALASGVGTAGMFVLVTVFFAAGVVLVLRFRHARVNGDSS